MTKKYECGYTTQHYFKVGEYVDVKIVIALRDIPEHNVKKGDEGGCIESEANLSQKGNCWVGKTGIVYGKTTKVKDDALVEGYVHDGAVVGGKVRIA
ncbi:hypothetical protein H0G72_05725, partial [Liberibacter sp. Z1]|nr:hypothetical protein [Candidatus Liberibacter sp.]